MEAGPKAGGEKAQQSDRFPLGIPNRKTFFRSIKTRYEVGAVTVEKKLKELGIELPEPPKPLGAYVPAVVVPPFVFVSGEKASVRGVLRYKGKVGKDLTLQEGYEAARVCAINCLACLKSAVGDLGRIERIVKVEGYINSADGFNQQPKVLNGASDLLLRVFGDAGQHARVAVGVNELPDDSPVEVSMIAKLRE